MTPETTSVTAPNPLLARYARQTVLPAIGVDGQERLGRAHVALVGCGALGSAIADLLVRAGIGRLTVIDRDYVELHNLQRQSLYDEDDVHRHLPKAAAASEKLNRINGAVTVEPVVADVNPANIERLVAGAGILIDGTDNFETRYLVNDVAVKHGLPWVYGGVLATHGMSLTIRPGVSPCLRCIFPDPPEPGTAPTCDTAGVLGPAVHVIAAIQAAEAIKLAVGDLDALNHDLLAIDLWHVSIDRIRLGGPDPGCPACARREFTFLEAGAASQETVLCGHDAVQVMPRHAQPLDLVQLADRLRPAGEVLANRFLLRFTDPVAGCELTIFPDGRAIIKGTTDPVQARSLYARYVGS